MKTFLISHTNEDGTGVAQATIIAISEAKAKEKFRVLYPERVIHTVGEEGQG